MKWISKERVEWFQARARKALAALVEEILIIAITIIVGAGMLFILSEGCRALLNPFKDLH